jgi:hypothetical protein
VIFSNDWILVHAEKISFSKKHIFGQLSWSKNEVHFKTSLRTIRVKSFCRFFHVQLLHGTEMSSHAQMRQNGSKLKDDIWLTICWSSSPKPVSSPGKIRNPIWREPIWREPRGNGNNSKVGTAERPHTADDNILVPFDEMRKQ